MFGLTVRWSLRDAPAGTADALRAYVRDTSEPRFTGMPGLIHKTWQLADGGFSGVYVWATSQARADFLAAFRAAPSAVTQLIGSDPEIIEEWELVGVAEGSEGPLASPR